MEKVKAIDFKKGQGVLEIEFAELKYGQKDLGLEHYCKLISEAETLEEACTLILSIPNLANARPYSNDFHNSLYCLADLTRSLYREVALCATWAILGSGFYNTLLNIGAHFPSQVFGEFYFEKLITPPEENLLSLSIAKIQLFLGESGPIADAYPRYPKVQVDGKPYRYIQRLVPDIKYDEVVKRFLKATYDQPQAGRALFKFGLFEELVRGGWFDVLDELEKYICENTIPGKVLTVEQVEAIGVYSNKGHACSAWRRLKAMQKER